MIDNLISKKVLKLESYEAEPKNFGTALDKNEIPWGLTEKVEEALIGKTKTMSFNRYPDSECTAVKAAVSEYTGIDTNSISVGNGSDEMINLTLQIFVDPGEVIVVNSPTFSMYKLCGTLCGAEVLEYKRDSNFRFNLRDFISFIKKEKAKLVFLCNPNNPDGSLLELSEIEQVLKEFSGIVVVDEAYFEFSGLTASGLLSRYENLIILRTLSKAFGIAGLRVGYMLADPAVISYIDRIRSPYNVNSFAQAAAVEVLENVGTVRERVEIIRGERERLSVLLRELKNIQSFESRSNFIMICTAYAGEIYSRFKEAGIFIRRYSDPMLKDCLRVTIGAPSENDRLIKILKEVLNEDAK